MDNGELHTAVRDPGRLAALRRTALLDTPPEEAFERLTRLATRLLKAPVSLVSLIDEDRQFFKSARGLSEPWASRRETPLSHSFCQHVVANGDPLVVNDARAHPTFKENPAVRDLDFVAYLGVPLVTSDRFVLGTLCVIDHEPREWTEDQIETLRDLSAVAMREIELRMDRMKAQRTQEWFEFLAEASVILSSSLDYRHTLTRVAGLVVPRLADWCIVYEKKDDGSIERTAIEHRDPMPPGFLEQLSTFKLAPGAPSGVAKVIKTGRSELVPDADAELLAADVDDPERLVRLIRPLGVSSWMCVPMWARGSVLGAISFIGDGRRRYRSEHLRLAEEVTRRAALALDNARLYERLEKRRTET